LKDTFWPALKVTGRFNPLIVKPEPETLACEIVTLEPPELVSVPARVLGAEVCTLPKFRLEGTALSEPAADTVPVNGTMRVPLDASLANDSAPLPEPFDCGLKVTLKGALCPAAKVSGRFSPLKLKPEPETFAWETVTAEPPVLVSAPDKV
jgi:hypothetical protein